MLIIIINSIFIKLSVVSGQKYFMFIQKEKSLKFNDLNKFDE